MNYTIHMRIIFLFIVLAFCYSITQASYISTANTFVGISQNKLKPGLNNTNFYYMNFDSANMNYILNTRFYASQFKNYTTENFLHSAAHNITFSSCFFENIQLKNTKLSYLNLYSVIFKQASFKRILFTNSTLKDVHFKNSTLKSVVFLNCDITNLELTGSNIDSIFIFNSTLDDASKESLEKYNVIVGYEAFTLAASKNKAIKNAKFELLDFGKLNLSTLKFNSTEFKFSTLDATVLRFSKFNNTTFFFTTFSKANLYKSLIKNSKFNYASIIDSNFKDSLIKNTLIKDSKFTNVSFDKSKWENVTIKNSICENCSFDSISTQNIKIINSVGFY